MSSIKEKIDQIGAEAFTKIFLEAHEEQLEIINPEEFALYQPHNVRTIFMMKYYQELRKMHFRLFQECMPQFESEGIAQVWNALSDTDIPKTAILAKLEEKNYCAVRNGKFAGIYPCSPEDDPESWETKYGKHIFPHYEAAVHFTTDVQLKVNDKLIAVAFEAFEESSKKEHEFFQKGFFDYESASLWINKNIEKFSGPWTYEKTIDYKPSEKEFWSDEFEVDGWTFCIIWIEARVVPDPRYTVNLLEVQEAGNKASAQFADIIEKLRKEKAGL